MNATPLHLRRVIAALLLATGALFVVGVAIERRDEHRRESTEQSAAAERHEGSEAEHRTAEVAHSASHEGKEARVFGVDTEATPLVVVAVLVSIALAVLGWRSDSEILLAVVAMVAAVFAVFDTAEVIRQIDGSHALLAITAAIVAVGHASIAVLGATALRRSATRLPQ